MGDNITLKNGLVLGNMFQEKEKIIQQLEEENACLRTEKGLLVAENQTVLREQAQVIDHLNQQLRLLTNEQTKHFSTLEILETVKMEKNFLEEDSVIQEEERKKLKEHLRDLQETLIQRTAENSTLAADLAKETLSLQQEKTENFTLSCLIGERDVTIEQCRSELARVKKDLDTLKHALSSKDTKLKHVLEERNQAQWKLQDYMNSNLQRKDKVNKNSSIPVTPPRTPQKTYSTCPTNSMSVSPTTITANLTPKKDENTAALQATVRAPSTQLTMEDTVTSFDLKEKHYLSLIFRLRSELAKMKKMNEDSVNLLETKSHERLPLKSNFVRKTSKPLKR